MSVPEHGCQAAEWLIANEFAQVRLTIDRSGNGPRLCVEDVSSGLSILLDPFLLSGLTTAPVADLSRYMDPNPIGQDIE